MSGQPLAIFAGVAVVLACSSGTSLGSSTLGIQGHVPQGGVSKQVAGDEVL